MDKRIRSSWKTAHNLRSGLGHAPDQVGWIEPLTTAADAVQPGIHAAILGADGPTSIGPAVDGLDALVRGGDFSTGKALS
jgi:hypothetical protein